MTYVKTTGGPSVAVTEAPLSVRPASAYPDPGVTVMVTLPPYGTIAELEEMAPVPLVTEVEMAKVVIPAEHDAVPPPSSPAQLQFQGPEPVTTEADPEEQRFAVGTELRV